MAQERRPHPAKTGSGRKLRGEDQHAPIRTRRPSEQHARGERILRDGTRVAPRPATARTSARPAPRRRGPRTWGTTRLPLASAPRRLHAVLIIVAMGLSLCAGRLLQLQGFDSSSYAATSAEALTRTLPLFPARGQITDRNGLVLASTQPAVAVTADPTLTTPRAAEIAGILSGRLQMTEAQLFPLLTKTGTHFVYIKKKVPALTYTALAADLSARGIYGVFRESDPIRSYPSGPVAASVIGFVGADGKGLAGLEQTLDSQLAGVEGKETYESSPNGSKIPLGQSSVTPAVNGINFQTTIDSEVQWAAERRLANKVARSKADSGFAITMNIKTGEILALANVPSFDASRPTESNKDDRGNRAVSAPYEPGSVEKILTAAALVDSGTAHPETKVVIPPLLKSGGGTIKDAFTHDPSVLHYNLRGAVARSSNIGMALLTRQLSKQKLHDYLASFGLGAKTGIEVPGEASGIRPATDMTDSQRDQVAFGQALSVTGVQEAAAIAGIVNGGIYNPPTLIKKATDSAGNEVAIDRRPARRIISEQSSLQVRDLMRAVIDSPNGRRNLSLDNYQTGGKTGTAQRADTTCHCYKGYVTSYVGFAPLNDPQILTYVVVTDPHKGDTGTSVANPVFKDIMNIALPRYSVTPNTKKPKTLPIEW